ncbi:MAG: bifunctional homocysteine S-methyltransferase/methylenetetrahydrofolate reductase [Lachnospiraceae bacterium]
MTQAQVLKEQLRNKVILMDGAMGTYFNRLHPEEGEAEYANGSHPDWIKEIHKRYIQAGAGLIRTNTFAVNHMLFPLREDMQKMLVSAVKSAKDAVAEWEKEQKEAIEKQTDTDRKTVFIAGSIGPMRTSAENEEQRAIEEYQFICDTLLTAGIRIFIFETFADTGMVLMLSEYLREQAQKLYNEDIFILAQFSVNRMGYTKYGYSMKRLVRELEDTSLLDGFGFNCGIGVTHMNKLLAELTFSKDVILSALPNAGYDHMLRGRQLLLDNPDYYASVMEELLEKGVNLVGGCCGTTPEYIRTLASIVKQKGSPAQKNIISLKDENVLPGKTNPFMDKLNQGERVYVVEIDSPFNEKADKFLEAAYRLKENEIDLVTISDSPMARPRAEAFEMGIYIANQTGLRVMPHVCCRDRNLIALRSSILGGYINGIRDMLIITGDPVARDDRNIISSVFDFNSIRLMEYVKNMNAETFREEPFSYGGALNYAGVNIQAIADRMKKKMEAGCSYFLTQPVYSDADINRVRELKNMTGAKIILGIMPLVSYKNAVFMKNELPGIDVPEDVIERYHLEMERSEAEETAVDISVEIGKKALDFADGFYLMTPFNRVALVNRIINRLRELD